MTEHDPLVQSYMHLANMSRADEALRTLKKIASVVKPIMRNHKWKVKELAEFYPSQQNLLGANIHLYPQLDVANHLALGLNVNRGWRICLRLRYAEDKNQFLPLDQVIDTMLHELCHNVHGPHNSHFHLLWDKLRDEYMDLMLKGYTGEAFLSEGRRLGGGNMPLRDVRRVARQAGDKRQSLLDQALAGRRLGGKAIRTKSELRRAAADAAERRQRELQGCATDKLSNDEIRDLSEAARKNGFRTKAEEDEANGVAIAQALEELMSSENDIIPQVGSTRRSSLGLVDAEGSGSAVKRPAGSAVDHNQMLLAWVCKFCTLYNKATFLCCDACGAEKPTAELHEKKEDTSKSSKRRQVIDLT